MWLTYMNLCTYSHLVFHFPAVFYFVQLGIPAIRFSPIHDHPILLHDHNEYLNEKVYVEGIPIYEELLEAVASVIDTA